MNAPWHRPLVPSILEAGRGPPPSGAAGDPREYPQARGGAHDRSSRHGYVKAIDRSAELFGTTSFSLFGQDVGWYGIAGFAALFSGPVLYYVFRAIYGGPSTPSYKAGDEAIAVAEPAEDAAR